MRCVCGVYGTAGAVCRYVSDRKERVRQVEEITVEIGQLVTGNSGITNDTRQAVQFTGEELGSYREYGTDRYGKITDTRGTTQTLYRTADGGLVVHVYEWSRWVGEPDAEFLYAVTEKTLQHGGLYDRLGAACGFGRPLTLAEAIGPRRDAGTEPPAVDAFVDIEDNGELTLTLRGDNSDAETQHNIFLFAMSLQALGWDQTSKTVSELVGVLLGLVGEEHAAALEAGVFDAED